MTDPKSPQHHQLDEMWEECLEDRENRRKDEEFWQAVMQGPVFEDWEERPQCHLNDL